MQGCRDATRTAPPNAGDAERQRAPVPGAPAEKCKRFIVTLRGDDSTRYLEQDSRLSEALRRLAESFACCFSRGAIPQVSVELLPGGLVTAESKIEPPALSDPKPPGVS